MELVKKHGQQRWTVIADYLHGRIGKQCRERWHNHLRPDIKVSCSSNSPYIQVSFKMDFVLEKRGFEGR